MEELITKWYGKFSEMKPGQRIEIALTGKRDPDLFMCICKSYIDAGNMDFEISNDYKFFKRINNF